METFPFSLLPAFATRNRFLVGLFLRTSPLRVLVSGVFPDGSGNGCSIKPIGDYTHRAGALQARRWGAGRVKWIDKESRSPNLLVQICPYR